VLAGTDTFPDIVLFGCKKLALLRQFRPFNGGTPTHDHLGDIMAVLDAGRYQHCFVEERTDDGRVDLRLSPLIDPARLRRGNPFGLAFLARVGFELGDHARQVEECLAGGGGIDAPCRGAKGSLSLLQFKLAVPQILEQPRAPVDPGRDEGVARSRKVERHLELGVPVAAGSPSFLGANDVAARSL
jgi:hypothetical protein